MPAREPLDYLPLWGLFPLTVAVVLLSLEAGYRLGRYRLRHSVREKESPVGEVVAATLGLLAFLLAFTFGMAASHHEDRRGVVLDEANALGTTYLAPGCCPNRSALTAAPSFANTWTFGWRALAWRRPSRRFAGRRSCTAGSGSRPWPRRRRTPARSWVGLYVQSLNEVIDLHSKRVTIGLRTRIPGSIWFALYFVTFLGMAVLGYHGGLAGAGRSLAVLALALTFSGVIVLIADLDRPQEGLLRVSQQPMIDLRNTMNVPSQ